MRTWHRPRAALAAVAALGGLGLGTSVRATAIVLGSASNFAVLAGSTVTNTGPTLITGGDVGVAPGAAITGFPPGTIAAPFITEAGNAVAAAAESDLAIASNQAAGLAPSAILTGQNLGGLTLGPGVYFFASAAQLTGTLILDGEGDPTAQFVFQIGSGLTTSAASAVLEIDDPAAPGADVFWQVGSSATLGTGTDFLGNILADTSITAGTGAAVTGRLLAENGAVTLDDNAVTVPAAPGNPGGGSPVPERTPALGLLVAGLAAVGGWRRTRAGRFLPAA